VVSVYEKNFTRPRSLERESVVLSSYIVNNTTIAIIRLKMEKTFSENDWKKLTWWIYLNERRKLIKIYGKSHGWILAIFLTKHMSIVTVYTRFGYADVDLKQFTEKK
jgi:hypothetical protein